ncbi:MAG: 2-oxoglutarate dehydrogenase, E2 component, dihydrolipoamide succinyltransferase [Gammaproteobacteria bacterium]|nr:2-oxoglutarate dehydrogenase, E2 component, dihydrolipoamide succinyltransferase [Gammaproteobacteria bacterium]
MAKVEVKMPQMGESITEGTIITWHKQPGDPIEQDETLLEIGTDKVDTDVPAPEAGVLSEILVAEGDTVDVGTVIAVIETEAADAVTSSQTAASPAQQQSSEDRVDEPEPVTSAAGNGDEMPAVAAAPVPQPESAPVARPAANAPTEGAVEVVMPKMGESIIEGTIIAWHKQPGDAIELDEVLLEIATDKVDTEVPSPAAGVLQEILVAEGETVEVGTVIARIGGAAAVSAGAGPAPAADRSDAHTAAHSTDSGSQVSGDGAAAIQVGGVARPIDRKSADGRFFSPLVRSIAEKEGLSMSELESIVGSGHSGRLTKADLVAYLDSRRTAAPAVSRTAVQPLPGGEAGVIRGTGRTEVIEMDRMRQIISEHMITSKRTSAHVTSFAEVDVTNLVRLREKLKASFLQSEGVKLTYTPFFVKAAVDAIREHPLMNSSVDGTSIIVKKDIHVGIAVALGKTGLVVPVIRDAGDKNIAGLARAAATLAERARSKQLQPDDLQGGTFTVTNVGSLGSLMGTPIIAQPQVAILATGAIKKRPVVIEDEALGDVIAIRHMMYVSLSYDHRIIDGAMASSYLQRLILELESYTDDTAI